MSQLSFNQLIPFVYRGYEFCFLFRVVC